MPLASLSHLLPFLSASPPSVPKKPPVILHTSPVPPKEKPALRICFPLRIQRGQNSWWEYEEFRIQFRDRLMWRQAFRLDEEDSRETSFDDAADSSLGESSKTGSNAAAHDGDDAAFKSHWSYSTSQHSSALDRSLSDGSVVSKSSSQRLMELMTRLLSATPSQSDKSSASTREVSQPSASPPSSNHSIVQHQPLHPPPLNLPSRRMHSSPNGDASEDIETYEMRHHRNIALDKLEGKPHAKTKYMGFSTFRNMFRTHKVSTTQVISPALPAAPPLRPKSLPQDQGAIRISSEEWADLRDDIIGGLMGDAEGVFPFYTDRQKAMMMPVEQKENCFRVRASLQRESIPMGGLKAALEHIEARNWKDVIFVAYDDTPMEMRRWYTTREPQVLQWGVSMI